MSPIYRILHLEDVPSDAELAARELKKSFQIEHRVIDTEEAFVHALDTFQPDVILCDHSLPAFNSHEALKIVKKKKLHIPFILITATMSEEIAESLIKTGADDYILKDRLKRLPTAVINAIEKYRFEEERKRFIDEVQEKEATSNELLRQLSDKLLLATQVAGLGIWEYSTADQRFKGNDILLSLYGITADGFKGTVEGWMELIHPDDRQRVGREFNAALEQTATFQTEFSIVCPDGTIRFMQAVATVQAGTEGSTKRMIGTTQDITEQKRSERAIKESEARYRAFFENSMDGILFTSPTGEIVAANPAACAMFGMTEEEICQTGRGGIVDATDPALPRLIEERTRTGKAKGELTFIRKNGARFPVEISSQVFTDALGMERTSMILRDITGRKQAEQKMQATTSALKEAWNDLKKIMDSSLDVICSFDKEGRFVNVSSAAERIWGYLPTELRGQKYIELVQPDDRVRTAKVASEIMSGIPVTMFENRYMHKNGESVPILWSARWDENDQLMYCVAKDATEKKRLEQAFINEQNRFAEMFLNAPCSLGMLRGKDHVYEMANELYLELIGRKDIIGKPIREVLPEIEHQGFFELLDHVYTSGETFVAKERLVKVNKDGTGKLADIYLNFVYQPYRNQENAIEGIFFFAIDVTEQVKSRITIEESEKQFRQMVETAQEGIWMLDKANNTRFVNDKMCRILGYTEKEMLGKPPHFFLLPKSKETARRFLSETSQTGFDLHEDQFLTKSGKAVWLHLATNPIRDEAGHYKGALAMVTDMTERKQLEEQIILQKVQQQKEITKAALLVQEKERNFLGSELHDNINQILTAVKLHLKHFIDNPGAPAQIIENGYKHLTTAIEEIRKLSHNLVSHRFEEDSLPDAIHSLIDGFSLNNRIALHLTNIKEEAIEENIKLTLFRIIQEQLNNIVKYAQADSIQITLGNDDKEVHLLMEDNGVGFQTKKARSGVGITNIYNRVESFNGTVVLDSSPGKGCRLMVTIPLLQPQYPLTN